WKVWARSSKRTSSGVLAACNALSSDWISSGAVTSLGGCGPRPCSRSIDTSASHPKFLTGDSDHISGAADRSSRACAVGIAEAIIHIQAGFPLVAQQVEQVAVDVLAVADQACITQIGFLAGPGCVEEIDMLPGQLVIAQTADEIPGAELLGHAGCLQLRSHLGVHIIERSHCRRLLLEQPLQRRHVLIEQGLLLPVEQVGELLAQGCSPREQLAQLPHPSLSTSGAPAVTQDSRSISLSAMRRLSGW